MKLFFHSCIQKFFNTIGSKYELLEDTSKCIDKIMCKILDKVIDKTQEIYQQQHKKQRIDPKDISIALEYFLTGDLLTHSREYGLTFISSPLSMIELRKQMVFSPLLFKKYMDMKNNRERKNYTKECFIFLAGVLEYIIYEMLLIIEVEADLVFFPIISQVLLVEALERDTEFKFLVKKLNIQFFGYTCVIPKNIFSEIVKELGDVKLNSKAMQVLQEYIEARVVKIIEKAKKMETVKLRKEQLEYIYEKI